MSLESPGHGLPMELNPTVLRQLDGSQQPVKVGSLADEKYARRTKFCNSSQCVKVANGRDKNAQGAQLRDRFC